MKTEDYSEELDQLRAALNRFAVAVEDAIDVLGAEIVLDDILDAEEIDG